MLGSPCNPCCGCTIEKANGIWQELREKSVTLSVTGQLPRRDAASWTDAAYATGYKFEATPPTPENLQYQGWWVVNGYLKPTLAEVLSLPFGSPPGASGGTSHVDSSPAYSFGTKQLALDASTNNTSWVVQNGNATGTVRYAHDDGRCEYSATFTIRSSASPSASERLFEGCAFSARYSIIAKAQAAYDATPTGQRYSVTLRESPDPGWQYGYDMGFATVSPDVYERSPMQRPSDNAAKTMLLGGGQFYQYTGWWRTSQKPSDVAWNPTQDAIANGDFVFDQSGNMSASTQASIASSFGQWQDNPTPGDGVWVTDFVFNGGYLWNNFALGQSYGPFMHIQSITTSSQRYATVLAAGSAVPLSLTCSIL